MGRFYDTFFSAHLALHAHRMQLNKYHKIHPYYLPFSNLEGTYIHKYPVLVKYDLTKT